MSYKWLGYCGDTCNRKREEKQGKEVLGVELEVALCDLCPFCHPDGSPRGQMVPPHMDSLC